MSRRMADYLERATDAGSLDRIVSDDSDMALIDCVSYDSDIMEELENNYDRERIAELLHKLNWDEANLIRDFYGIDRTERLTFSEMGKRQGVSRERMRQKFNKAIMKLRTVYSRTTARWSFQDGYEEEELTADLSQVRDDWSKQSEEHLLH